MMRNQIIMSRIDIFKDEFTKYNSVRWQTFVKLDKLYFVVSSIISGGLYKTIESVVFPAKEDLSFDVLNNLGYGFNTFEKHQEMVVSLLTGKVTYDKKENCFVGEGTAHNIATKVINAFRETLKARKMRKQNERAN